MRGADDSDTGTRKRPGPPLGPPAAMTRSGRAGRGSGRRSPPPPRKRAVAVRHLAFEDLGSFEAVLSARGYRVHYMDAGADEPAALEGHPPDPVVVLGGPIGVYEEEMYPVLRGQLE